ncbi:MAG: hypothetical protein U0P45_11620 [Acidimicrobiales bacterium]
MEPVNDAAPAVGTAGAAAPSPRRRRWPWVLAGIVALAVVVLAGAVVALIGSESRPVPTWPKLTDDPDPSLHGTVAYTAPDGCVRVVAASGARSKQVLCVPEQDMAKAPKEGKQAGPQLRWRDDGRLEVTMFRWLPPANEAEAKQGPPDYEALWQKLVDVRTDTVTEVAASDLPAKPSAVDGPSKAPDGRIVRWSSDPSTGKVRVWLEAGDGERTLMAAHGPGKYGYDLQTASWSPTWDWVVADDGRILVITTGASPTTRILVEGRGMGSGGTAGPTFAVTEQDLLPGT